MNPFTALAELAVGFWKAGKAQAWAKLVFELLCSGFISFLMVCGGVLISPPHSWPIGIGSGMVSAAICMTVVFRRSPLTKGLLLVLPEVEATKELETDLQTIQRN